MVTQVAKMKHAPTPLAHKEALIRILYVDDELGFLKTAKQILEIIDPFQVETAASVKDAMKKLEKNEFDMVVSDYQMPEKNGLDFLRELREKGNNIPFILFTGKGREEVAIEALNLGANRYIDKIGKPETVYTELAHAINQTVEKTRTEEELAKKQDELQTIIDSSRMWIFYKDTENRFLRVNKSFAEVMQMHKEQLEGHSLFEYYPKEQAENYWKDDKQVMASGKPKTGILEPMQSNKGLLWVQTDKIPYRDAEGNIIGIIGFTVDITQQKKAEDELREFEEKYRLQFEEALDAIFLADVETGILVDCNRAATELVGRTKSELIGEHQSILHLPEETGGDLSRTFKEHVKQKEKQILESQVITKDGKIRDVTIKVTVFEVGNKKIMQGTFRDITEQKKAEKALRESAEKYRDLINAMNDKVWVIGFDGKFVDVNDAAVNALGYSREELLSMGPKDIDNALTAEEIKAMIKRMKTDELQVFETLHTTKDGKKIPVEISSSRVTYQGKPAILSIARNITDRKHAEDAVDAMVNELEKVIEKLRAVGKATRHDVRNKLAVIANNVYLAKQRLSGDHNASEHLDDIESAIGQIEDIFDFASTYEMIGVEERSYINVEKSVKEAAILFSGLGGTKLENECLGLTVLADSQLRQLFYNLIDNSMTHGERVTKIRVYYKEEKEEVLKLIYEDNGVGIPENEKELIFKEGYGKGTGYGLYLIQKICESYGWTIKETGEPGKGAQFTITVPKKNENWKINHQLQ